MDSRLLKGITAAAVVWVVAPAIARGAAPPKITAGPFIGGTPQAAQVLTASATWTGDPAPATAWAWLRCPRPNGGCVEIPDATSATYAVSAEDVGSVLRVRLIVTS